MLAAVVGDQAPPRPGVSDFEVECEEPQVHFHVGKIRTHAGGSGESHHTALVQRKEC